ncbi:MAG: LVIVD repeat-containing protein [Candidatus Thorarchaeota archaeon]
MRIKKLDSLILLLLAFSLCIFNIQFTNTLAKSGNEIQFTQLCEISTFGRTDFIEFVDNYSFVFDFEKGFLSYDITNPEEPILLDTLAFSNTVDPPVQGGHDFIIKDDDIAIVDYMHAGIKFVNISDPSELTVLGGYYSGTSEYFMIDYWENKIYCAKAEGGLEVFEFYDNYTIKSIGSYAIGHTMSQIECFQEDMVYIADYDRSGDLLLNVTDPENITELQVFDWMAGNILFQEDLMYATIIRPDDEGLRIYNNTNPLDPVLVGELKGFEAYSPLIEDNYLFLAGTKGLQIIDITDPTNPQEIAQYYEDEIAYKNLAKKGNIIGLVDFEDTWFLIQVENLDSTKNGSILGLNLTFLFVNLGIGILIKIGKKK